MESSEAITAKELQKRLSYGLSDSNDCVFWDLYTENDKEVLYKKISVLMPDARPDIEIQSIKNENLIKEEEEKKCQIAIEKCNKYNSTLRKQRSKLYDQIWLQRKYNGGNLLSTIVYVMLVEEDEFIKNELTLALESSRFSVHPLFRVRKCIIDNDSSNCCMVFIDESGRVYQNWNDYLNNNTLPKGVMVFPKNGIYNYESDQVILNCQKSPACSAAQSYLQIADRSATCVGIAAAAVVFLPVAPLIGTISTVAGGGAWLYSVCRSTTYLVDRSMHEQSINVTDREARNSWISVAGGIAGVTSGAATRLLSRVAANATSEVPIVLQYLVNGANLSTIALSGAGVGYGLIDCFIAYKDENIRTLDMVQLAASLVLFTHSVHNYQSATTIIENSQIKTIDQFMKQLSIRQRKAFNKLKLETFRIKGAKTGQYDVIRAIKTVPDNKYFNDVYKMILLYLKNNIRAKFGDNGNVILNNERSIQSSELRQNVQQNPNDNILHQVDSGIPSPYMSNQNSMQKFSFPIQFSESRSAFNAITDFLQYIPQLAFNEQDYIKCILNIYVRFQREGVEFIFNAARKFSVETRHIIEEQLHRILPFEGILGDIFKLILSNENIMQNLDNLPQYLNYLLAQLKEYYLTSIRPSGQGNKCKYCAGHFFTINLDS